jgi:toxin ParE1/3/4
MQQKQCVFSTTSRTDPLTIGDYIGRDNPERTYSFVEEIEQFCHSIALMPQAYPLRENLGPDIRRTSYGCYLIFYSVSADVVRIERILHSARDIDEEFFIQKH